ncbi:helix-turn-helix domain-containing protein [Streptomyces sp. NPDC048002]|uniref:helix-turn-helix domain-containing protein n=1 Tax=Streptomyces sp. NPDC048002 TaxID=3154344 RepID=UPI0033E53112
MRRPPPGRQSQCEGLTTEEGNNFLMDTQNLSAPACARPLNPRGITHINTPHRTRCTVVGDHLSQHQRLSLTAIGLALHIQSLPEETLVDIKSLSARFAEGEARIASALRELKAHGYLAQVRTRLPNGQIITHTVSYNQPLAQARHPEAGNTPDPAPRRLPPPPTPRTHVPEPSAGPLHEPAPATGPKPSAPPRPTASETPLRKPAPMPTPMPTSMPTSMPVPKPQLPAPQTPDADRERTAADLLATLQNVDPRLLLSERAVRRLAPAVATWLERGARPEAVRHALSADLPQPLRNPAALLAHRLADLLPPPAPSGPDPAAPGTKGTMINCNGCDRGFRSPVEGAHCRDCRAAGLPHPGRP